MLKHNPAYASEESEHLEGTTGAPVGQVRTYMSEDVIDS